MTPDAVFELAKRVVGGDVRAIARAISLVEDETPEAGALIARLYPHAGRAYLVGVTGAPGAGKSTLVDRLTTEARRAGLTVGVLAIDPTSPFTGGALLGDRVRMTAHARDAGVFIRSMATRGHLGGLARATADATVVLDAAGCGVVFIETVGVGQGEVDIAAAADISIVVLVPGTGDDVQTLKAGIMEIGDIFVVNKADREGADRLAHAVTASLSLQSTAPDGWRPPVLKTQATSGVGVEDLWAAIGRFRAQAGDRGRGRRRARVAAQLRERVGGRLLADALARLSPGEFDRIVDAIAAGELDPYSAADRIVEATVGRQEQAGRA
jgi:LAO/AO transport system kinase